MERKRKRKGRTDYRKRLKLLMSNKARLVIRISSKNIVTQIVQYEPKGDKALVSASTKELAKLGYKGTMNNTPCAHLMGMLIAKKAKEKYIIDVIPDFGLKRIVKGSKLFAVVEGAKEGGLKVKIEGKAQPKKERIEGKHIEQYSKTNKNNFSKYQINPEDLSKHVNEIKEKLRVK